MEKVNDFIMVHNTIPADICKQIKEQIDAKEWKKHQWFNYQTGTYQSESEKELDVQSITPELQQQMMPLIVNALRAYQDKYAQKDDNRTKDFLNTFTPIRFNRYPEGSMMRKHYDHIHSIFDGKHKGVPILSLVGVLNEDYEGGEFIFNNTHEVKLKTGDILMFPSNFMFAHEVKEITKGTRYSFVSWAF